MTPPTNPLPYLDGPYERRPSLWDRPTFVCAVLACAFVGTSAFLLFLAAA